MATKKTTATATTDSIVDVIIPQIDTKIFKVKIVGDSPLLMHAWSEKAKKQMLDVQTKAATKGKAAKDPWDDYVNSMYWLTEKPEDPTEEDVANATFGFPAVAFKECALDAGYQQGVIAKKTTARGAFTILGEFAVIDGHPRMREDMVKVGGMTKVADIRYRGEFPEWSTTLTIKFNPRAITAEQIVNLLNYGGFCNGVGEWRQSKGGYHGSFHVETA